MLCAISDDTYHSAMHALTHVGEFAVSLFGDQKENKKRLEEGMLCCTYSTPQVADWVRGMYGCRKALVNFMVTYPCVPQVGK